MRWTPKAKIWTTADLDVSWSLRPLADDEETEVQSDQMTRWWVHWVAYRRALLLTAVFTGTMHCKLWKNLTRHLVGQPSLPPFECTGGEDGGIARACRPTWRAPITCPSLKRTVSECCGQPARAELTPLNSRTATITQLSLALTGGQHWAQQDSASTASTCRTDANWF